MAFFSPTFSVHGDQLLKVRFMKSGKNASLTILKKEGDRWNQVHTTQNVSPEVMNRFIRAKSRLAAEDTKLRGKQKLELDGVISRMQLYGIDPETSATAISTIQQITDKYATRLEKLWLGSGSILKSAKGDLVLHIDRKNYVLLKNIDEISRS
jgi:hypothetical protein